MVREKYLENEIFSRSGNFVHGQGNLERTLKVRELGMAMSGRLRKFIYSIQRGEIMYFLMR